MISVRRATAADASVVGRLVDALLSELGNTTSKLSLRFDLVVRLLAMKERVFGLLAYDGFK